MTDERVKIIALEAELADARKTIEELEASQRPGFFQAQMNNALNWAEFGLFWAKRKKAGWLR